jgi:probable HAF family extracellular repeat protein
MGTRCHPAPRPAKVVVRTCPRDVGRSIATGINNRGQVIGWSDSNLPSANNPGHAFLYSGRKMHDLMAGSNFVFFYSEALGINDIGEVVGWIQNDDTNFTQEGFIYEGGQTVDLFPLGVHVATAIDDAGRIVGQGSSAPVTYSGVVFRYMLGQVLFQATLAGNPSAINNRGQVVGSGFLFGVAEHAFLYSGGQIRDLGALGSNPSLNSAAYGLNERGQVVGTSEVVPYVSSHAFLYSGGTMQDLGTLGGTNRSRCKVSRFLNKRLVVVPDGDRSNVTSYREKGRRDCTGEPDVARAIKRCLIGTGQISSPVRATPRPFSEHLS